jgi:hypothetical protein
MEYTIDNLYYLIHRTTGIPAVKDGVRGEILVSPEGKGLGDRRFSVKGKVSEIVGFL